MSEPSEDNDLAELRALIANNTEAMQRLRAMVERLEVALAAVSHTCDVKLSDRDPEGTKPGLEKN